MGWFLPAILLGMLLAIGGFVWYDRRICRPRCWRHGHRPDLEAIGPDLWSSYFRALPNVLASLRRHGFPSPLPGTLCAWRLDRFEGALADAVAPDLAGRIAREDFLRCHRALAFLVRLGFPRSLHHSACVTRLREALDRDRVDASRHAQARASILEHERRLGVLAQAERRLGNPFPPGAAEFGYALMLRWEALFEEHGYVLHPDLEAWTRERRELGL